MIKIGDKVIFRGHDCEIVGMLGDVYEAVSLNKLMRIFAKAEDFRPMQEAEVLPIAKAKKGKAK